MKCKVKSSEINSCLCYLTEKNAKANNQNKKKQKYLCNSHMLPWKQALARQAFENNRSEGREAYFKFY